MIHLLFAIAFALGRPSMSPQAANKPIALADSLSYRYYQSAVRALSHAPQPMPVAVCDLMETFTGLPARLDPAPVIAAWSQQAVRPQAASFMQYTLEDVGLMALTDSGPPPPSELMTHYTCPKGTVLTWNEPARLAPNKIVSLLQQGIKGIVVNYDYCARDWKKGNWHLDDARKRHKPKGTHAVLIVGYQDSSFIFKNSWSTAWGDGGYGLMSFDYHRRHVREGLVAYLAEAVEPKTDQIAGLAIKLQPEILDGQRHMQVSVVAAGPGKLPKFTELAFMLAEHGISPVVAKSLLLETARSTGYPCLLKLQYTDRAISVYVSYQLASGGAKEQLQFINLKWENAEILMKDVDIRY